MLVKAPFRLPPGFLHAFGYSGDRRLVALYWEPCGDEACFDDGVTSACGLCDNWLYLDYVRLPNIERWLRDNGIHLGNSDEPARHWLVVDALSNDLYAAPVAQASAIVRTQQLPS
jgi:hypothetical protein